MADNRALFGVAKISYQLVTRQKDDDMPMAARSERLSHIFVDPWKFSEGLSGEIMRAKAGQLDTFHDDRVSGMIMYKQYCRLHELFSKSMVHMHRMAVQVLNGLHGLYDLARILHRDVSVKNIMYEMRDDGPWFILIDFDLATILEEDGTFLPATSAHRTGTLPFLAEELLMDMYKSDISVGKTYQSIPHRLRYDFESLFLVSLYCSLTMPTARDKEQAEQIEAEVRRWEQGTSYLALATHKGSLVENVAVLESVPLPPMAAPLFKWFLSWQTVLRRGRTAMGDRKTALHYYDPGEDVPEFDEETAGGTITCDTLVTKLSSGWQRVKLNA